MLELYSAGPPYVPVRGVYIYLEKKTHTDICPEIKDILTLKVSVFKGLIRVIVFVVLFLPLSLFSLFSGSQHHHSIISSFCIVL